MKSRSPDRNNSNLTAKDKTPLYVKRKRSIDTETQDAKKIKTSSTPSEQQGSPSSKKSFYKTKPNATSKKRKAQSNQTYHPGDENKKKKVDPKKQYNAFRLRTDNRKYTNAEETVSVKTAWVINKDRLPKKLFHSPFKKAIHRKFNAIESHRSIKVTKSNPQTGSPLEGVTNTPSKTKVRKIYNLGFASYLSNQPIDPHLISPKRLKVVAASFYQSEQYKAIVNFNDAVKEQTTLITAKSLEKSAAQNKLKSSRNQNKQMLKKGFKEKAASATSYIKAAKPTQIDIENVKWEWLHLIAHKILADKSQTADNLITGTDHANTLMMMTEAQLNMFSKAYPDGFTLRVRANLVPDTHIGTTISYEIITKDFTLPILFDAQTMIKPHSVISSYQNILMKALLNYAENSAIKGLSPEKGTPINYNQHATLFYSKTDKTSRKLTFKSAPKKEKTEELSAHYSSPKDDSKPTLDNKYISPSHHKKGK